MGFVWVRRIQRFSQKSLIITENHLTLLDLRLAQPELVSGHRSSTRGGLGGWVWFGFVEFSGSLSDQSQPLGSLHLRLSSHGSLPKSLDLSLSVFQTKRERKNKKERSERENEENKRIKKKYNKKRIENNI
jgi:hypothetical protein